MSDEGAAVMEMRRCIGSAKFGIEPHEAPVEDFPKQPSQKDGLGRMCRPHWNQYTTALRKASLGRKAAEGESTDAPAVEAVTDTVEEADAEKPARARRRGAKAEEVSQEGASS